MTREDRQEDQSAVTAQEALVPGVLCNPAGGRIKNHVRATRQALKSIPAACYQEAVTSGEISESIRLFSEAGINLLILAGGDGTVHCALSRMFHLWRGELPALALVPGGTTNMTALDLGITQKHLACIPRLAASLQQRVAMRFTSRRVLRLRHGSGPELYGMFFGCGLIPHGVKYFHHRVSGLGVTHELAGGMVMLGYLLGFLLRPSALPAMQLDLTGGGRSIEKHVCLAAFCTTLERLLLGFRPYRNLERGSLRFTIIDNTMKSVWAKMISMLAGNGGWKSEHNRERLELLFDGDFIVDGELYHARHRDGPVIITRTAPLRFMMF